MGGKMDRRKFLRWSLASAAGLGLIGLTYGCLGPGSREEETGSPPEPGDEPATDLAQKEARAMPRRRLGRTGMEVGVFSLGGEATVQREESREAAEAIIHRALDLGVNYIDTSPRYGQTGSEANIGRVMQERRDEVYLATKTHERDYEGTMRLVEESLERLQTDYLDLYQVHNVREHADLDQALGDRGAVAAMERLREEGVIRHIGITGHRNAEVLLRGIRDYDFDCLLVALNPGDAHHDPFQRELLDEAQARDMGVIAMKVTAVGRLFRPDGISSMDQALGYVWTLPVDTAIVGISKVEQVEENARIARDFSPFSREKMAELESLVEPYHEEANFFKLQW